MVKTIARGCAGSDSEKNKGVERALKEHKLPYIKKVYRFYREHPEMSGLCMHLLTGMEFVTDNKKDVTDALLRGI